MLTSEISNTPNGIELFTTKLFPLARPLRRLGAAAAVLMLAACASTGHRAPVEERSPQMRPLPPVVVMSPTAVPSAPGQASVAEPGKPAPALPGAENAGKSGYYTVKPGDTLIRIGLDHGQNWRDIARWSALSNPNIIEVGQMLRVVPPGAVLPPATAGVAAAPAMPTAPAATLPGAVTQPMGSTPGVESRSLDGRPLTGAAAAGAAASAAAGIPPVAATPAAPTGVESDEDVVWAWPSSGAVFTVFDDTRSKGVGIAGKAGDPVLAAADGRVVYAGAGLRGYGNLVIVKHNATYLTAYAHNQRLLVKEDEPVRRGQHIADMGSTDSDRVKLHFEVRRQGKPIDPASVLPRR